jgi:hypothetical protein
MTTQKTRLLLLSTNDDPPIDVSSLEPIATLPSCHRKLAELLSQMIGDGQPGQPEIPPGGTTFEQLSRLAVATETISTEFLPVLLQLDHLCERLEHQHDATIEASDAEAVYAAVRPLGLLDLGFELRGTPEAEVVGVALVLMATLNAAHAKLRLIRQYQSSGREPALARAVLAAWGDERYPKFEFNDV